MHFDLGRYFATRSSLSLGLGIEGSGLGHAFSVKCFNLVLLILYRRLSELVIVHIL